MSDISGQRNEYEFVKYLNNKKISELNTLCLEFVNTLFPNSHPNSIITCWKNHAKQKFDIFIKINGIIKGISIKKGSRNSVHVERISDFIHFLIENKINREIIIEYLKYHYADGSTNGKGNRRISVEEYKQSYSSSIEKINQSFNNQIILKKAIERFVTKGKNADNFISAIIYGEINDFVWLTTEQIEKLIMSKSDSFSSAVHFGALTCQPKNRCLNYNPLYEKDRYCIHIKWYNIFDDIIELYSKNNEV